MNSFDSEFDGKTSTCFVIVDNFKDSLSYD
jgi:hypothetical protein